MANGPYLILVASVFGAGLLAGVLYFVYMQRKTILEISDSFEVVVLTDLALILSCLFWVSTCILFYMSPDSSWFNENHIMMFNIILLGFGGLAIAQKREKTSEKLVNGIEFIAFLIILLLLPEGTQFFNNQLPLDLDNILAVILCFSYFKLLQRLNRLEGYTLVNALLIGMTLFGAVFIASSISVYFYQYFGLLFPVMLSLMLFYIAKYKLPISPIVNNFLCVLCAFAPFYMISQGLKGAALLLMAYPLLEVVVISCRFLRSLMVKTSVVFLYETLLDRNVPAFLIVNFIFRRSFVLCAIALLSLRAQLQYQPVVLGILFMTEFYVRVVSPSTQNATIKELFSDVVHQAKDGFKETSDMLTKMKSKYTNKDKE